jgi:hypothetical protein
VNQHIAHASDFDIIDRGSLIYGQNISVLIFPLKYFYTFIEKFATPGWLVEIGLYVHVQR